MSLGFKNSCNLNVQAFIASATFTLFCAIFILLHYLNFEPVAWLYWSMIMISVLWLMGCVRSFIVVPYNPFLEKFTVIYGEWLM